MIPFLLYLLLRRFSTRSVVIGNLRHTFSLSCKERVRGEVIYNTMNIYWHISDQSKSEISIVGLPFIRFFF